jgi:GNAT superfamily N-acetyltransferase
LTATGWARPAIRAATLADVSGIARVHVDAWRSTYRGIVSQAFLDGLSYRDREALWTRVLSSPPGSQGLFVAEESAQGIVGFAHGAPPTVPHATYEGELYAIYLLEAFQGRGLGRDLILKVVAWFIAHGIRSMMVWVLTDNAACRFYEALGGRRIDVKRIEIGGDNLEEVAYGWADVTKIPGFAR